MLQPDALDTPDMLCVLASKLPGVLTERWKREVSKVTSCKQENLIWMTLHGAYQSWLFIILKVNIQSVLTINAWSTVFPPEATTEFNNKKDRQER